MTMVTCTSFFNIQVSYFCLFALFLVWSNSDLFKMASGFLTVVSLTLEFIFLPVMMDTQSRPLSCLPEGLSTLNPPVWVCVQN